MKRKPGRPSIYSDKLASAICLRLAEGESLRNICKDAAMPDKSTVLKWLFDGEHKDFAAQYTLARQAQAELLADEIIAIADDASEDFPEDRDGKPAVDHENVQRSRLKVDTRKWVAAKLLPKVYGDKLQHTGDGGGPVTFVMNLDGENKE